jgi:hypothetical protein
MINRRFSLALACALVAGAIALPTAASADNLLINRVKQEKGMNLPTRGMTMAQVEKRYGAPQRKLQPRGGDTQKHPVINRWDYKTFIVYFEHDHVIHSVLNTPAGNNHDPATAQ